MIVQYAPGTQVNCNGLLGLVSCLVNDVVKLGGTILGQLPLVNGVVALLDGNGILNLSNQQRCLGRECGPRVAVELHRIRDWRGADRQWCEQ